MKKALILSFALMMLTMVSQAQEPPNFDDNPPEGGPAPIPVDGGISLIAAAGIGLASKRLKLFSKKAQAA